MNTLAIFVPVRDIGVPPRSAIVGRPAEDGILIDFEQMHETGEPATFEERLQVAGGRASIQYNNNSRRLVGHSDVCRVGSARHLVFPMREVRDPITMGWYVESITNPELLARWIDPEELPAAGGSRAYRERAVAAVYIHRGFSVQHYAQLNGQATREGRDLVNLAFDTLLRDAQQS